MGLVAAMCEMLLQDNIPGYVSLLPALPKAMQGIEIVLATD